MTGRKLKLMLNKKSVRTAIALLCCALIIVCASVPIVRSNRRFSAKETIQLSEIFIKETDRIKINLTAYRCFSSQAPENTLPAIKEAAKTSFRSVEMDLRLTEDDVWVLSSDSRVNAMTDKRGKISSYTYYDLITCDINRGANIENYENLKIPTLEQALKVCLECNSKPFLNLLDCSEESIQPLIDIIEANGFSENCRVMCQNREILEKINEINPNITTILYAEKLNGKKTDECLDFGGGVCIDADKNLRKEKNIKKLIDSGLTVYCLDAYEAETMQFYFDIGICEFITDRVYK